MITKTNTNNPEPRILPTSLALDIQNTSDLFSKQVPLNALVPSPTSALETKTLDNQSKRRMYRGDLRSIQQQYQGVAHRYKLQRSPSGTFAVDSNVSNPEQAMNTIQLHNHYVKSSMGAYPSRLNNQANTMIKNANIKPQLSKLIDDKINLYSLLNGEEDDRFPNYEVINNVQSQIEQEQDASQKFHETMKSNKDISNVILGKQYSPP